MNSKIPACCGHHLVNWHLSSLIVWVVQNGSGGAVPNLYSTPWWDTNAAGALLPSGMILPIDLAQSMTWTSGFLAVNRTMCVAHGFVMFCPMNNLTSVD